MKQLERTEAALKLAMDGLHELACLGNGECYGNSTGNEIAVDYIEKVRGVILPPLKMEEVELVRWESFRDDGFSLGVFATECEAMNRLSYDHHVKLTGTYLRAKPVPVERSVSINQIKSLGIAYSENGNIFQFQCGIDTIMSQEDADMVGSLSGTIGNITFTFKD